MTPTMELRFVERVDNTKVEYVTVRILQQKWAGEYLNPMTGNYAVKEEWRDVTVEKDQT